MSINKRECRKFADPGLTISPNNGLFCMNQVNYVVRTAVRNISGRRTLLLCFYSKKMLSADCQSPIYTLFQLKDEYIMLERLECGKIKWRTACLSNFKEYRFLQQCALYSMQDQERITRFCGQSTVVGLSALIKLQTSIMEKRSKERIRAREQKTIQRMSVLSPVPRDFRGWIHREVLPAYIFYEYHRSKKPMVAYCTACRHDVSVSGVKHGESGLCPRCKRAITFKATGRSKNVWDQTTAQLLQRTESGELILRIFKVFKSYRAYREAGLSAHENARVFVKCGKEQNICVEPYYYSYTKGTLTHWLSGERPRFSFYQYNYECDVCGKLYCGNLAEVLEGTPWQYCQILRFYGHDNDAMEVIPYLRAYLVYPMIEYLLKLGLHNLTTELVYGNDPRKPSINASATDIKGVLMVDTEDIKHLQCIDATASQLQRLQLFRAREGRFEKELYVWCLENEVYFRDVERALKYTTGQKLLRYIREQQDRSNVDIENGKVGHYGKISDILRDYDDYLRYGDQLSYDFSDSFVLFPRHLKVAHDQVFMLWDMRMKQERERAERQRKHNANVQIAALYKALTRQFKFTKDGLTIVLPQKAEDIVFEGHALHHCVGGRYDSHANGHCVILFIRKKDSPDKPYCTMEVANGRVVQVRGYDNETPAPEVKKFVSLWEQKKLLAGSSSKAA